MDSKNLRLFPKPSQNKTGIRRTRGSNPWLIKGIGDEKRGGTLSGGGHKKGKPFVLFIFDEGPGKRYDEGDIPRNSGRDGRS
jgi:hypothetical protein